MKVTLLIILYFLYLFIKSVIKTFFFSTKGYSNEREFEKKSIPIIRKIITVFRDYSIFIICMGVYCVLRDLVPLINPNDQDLLLAKIDYAIFGVNPFIWILRFENPFLSNVLISCYF